jgi:hypothetical protein
VESLFEDGEGQAAVDFIRQYWGEMIRRGAPTFWEHVSLDWPLEPGFSRILIAPHTADLHWASGTVPTPHGPVSVRWQRTDGRFSLHAHIPEGCAGRVVLPPGISRGVYTCVDGEDVSAALEGSQRALDIGAGMHEIDVKA